VTPQELIAECKRTRKRFDEEPAHEKLVTMLQCRDLLKSANEYRKSKKRETLEVPSLGTVFDAMAIVDEPGKDLWLRCEATERERFLGGMTAFFEIGKELDEEKSP
jgi:hypothetical protein